MGQVGLIDGVDARKLKWLEPRVGNVRFHEAHAMTTGAGVAAAHLLAGVSDGHLSSVHDVEPVVEMDHDYASKGGRV